MFSGWVGFWLFMCVYVVCDTWLYSRGHETLFWGYRTSEEKQLQQNIINNSKGETK